MRKILLVLLLLGICSGCAEKKQVFSPEPAVGYYPLKVGNFWEYRDGSDWYEYYLRKEIVGCYLLQGGIGAYKIRCFKTYTSYPDTVEHKDEWFTYQMHIDNEIREFSDLNDPDEYEILLRFPLEVGSSWQKPPKQMDSVWAISMFVDSVAAVENVTTPAGEFEDCYRIRKTHRMLDILGGSERWFKPQVGFVEYRHVLGPLEYSLVDYKIIR